MTILDKILTTILVIIGFLPIALCLAIALLDINVIN